MNDRNRKRLKALVDAMADGTATADDARTLSELLRDDPAAQDAYLDYIGVHASLSWEFRGGEPYDGLPSPSIVMPGDAGDGLESPSYGSLPRALLIATAGLVVVAAMILAIVWPMRARQQPATDRKLEAYATHPTAEQQGAFWQITQTAGARWAAEQQPRIGERRGAGRLKLQAGVVQLRFDNGVQALLAAPAELEVVDAMHATLHSGRVVFRVPPPAIGFTLETDEANVVDLGTEFGVHVEDVVGTEVQVYEGEVVAELKAGSQRRLESGQAWRFPRTTDLEVRPTELPFWPERFVRYLPDPDERERRRGQSPRSPQNSPQHQEITIVTAPTDVVVDGDLSDWDLSRRFTSHCDPPYDSFYYVHGAMMYDDEYLYISADVGDPFPMRSRISPREKRKLYGNGGCLAFRLSTDRDMGWPARGEGPGTDVARTMLPEDRNEQLVFLVLWYYAPEELPSLHVTYGMDWHGAQVNPSGYEGAFRRHSDGKGYTAEYAIPWALLSAADDPPRAGDTLACTWLVHWAGPGGLNWKGQLVDVVNPDATGWNFQNAATWGRAIYRNRKENKP